MILTFLIYGESMVFIFSRDKLQTGGLKTCRDFGLVFTKFAESKRKYQNLFINIFNNTKIQKHNVLL